MATYRGVVGASDVDSTFSGAGLKKRDVDEKILLLDPSTAIITSFTTKVKAIRKTNQRKFEWMVDADRANYITLTASASGTDTELTVSASDAKNVNINDVLYYPGLTMGEQMLVVGVNDNTGVITVVRQYGTTQGGSPISAKTLASGAILYNLGPVYGEKASIAQGIYNDPAFVWNYVEYFQCVVEMTKDQATLDAFGGDPRAHQHAKKIVEYTKGMEYKALFGIRHRADHSGLGIAWDNGVAYSTGGLQYFINTNVKNANGSSYNSTLFRTWAPDIFRYGSKRKALICSPEFAMKVNGWAESSVQYRPGDDTYGVAFYSWDLGVGQLDIIPHWLLRGMRSGISGAMNGDIMFVVDFNEVKRVIKDPITLEKDVQNPESLQTIKDVYQGKFGWQWGREQCHALIYGGA